MRRKNSFGDILKSMGKGLGELLLGFVRLVLKIMITFGLWLPALYALLGVILYKGASFDPFDFSVYSVIYLSGGVACVVCAVIITLRNIIVRPVKKAIEKKRDKVSEAWKDDEAQATLDAEKARGEETIKAFSPPEIEDFDEKPAERAQEEPALPPYLVTDEDFSEEKSAKELLFDKREWRPVKKSPTDAPKIVSAPKKEIPDVYFSKIDPSILVHEYSDRFELYRVSGRTTKFIGVENKA